MSSAVIGSGRKGTTRGGGHLTELCGKAFDTALAREIPLCALERLCRIRVLFRVGSYCPNHSCFVPSSVLASSCYVATLLW